LQVLRQELGVDTDRWAHMLKRSGGSLDNAEGELVRASIACLRHVVGLGSSELAVAAREEPALLLQGQGPLSATWQALVAVSGRREAGRIVDSFPGALLLDADDVRRRPAALASLGLDYNKLVKKNVGIRAALAAGDEGMRGLERVRAFLVSPASGGGPGMMAEQAARVLSAFPLLLTCNPNTHVAPLVRYLRETLGVDPAAQELEALYAWPSPEGQSIVEINGDFLLGLGYSPDALRDNVMLLTHSFENRVRPRGLFAVERLAAAAPLPPLRALTIVDDAAFCSAVGAEVSDFQAFARDLRRSRRAR